MRKEVLRKEKRVCSRVSMKWEKGPRGILRVSQGGPGLGRWKFSEVGQEGKLGDGHKKEGSYSLSHRETVP